MSSSNNPRQIKNILKAGIKLEKGMGRGKDRKADDKIIEIPQMI